MDVLDMDKVPPQQDRHNQSMPALAIHAECALFLWFSQQTEILRCGCRGESSRRPFVGTLESLAKLQVMNFPFGMAWSKNQVAGLIW